MAPGPYARILRRMTDFVWGVPLLLIATFYVRQGKEEITSAGVKWSIMLSIVGFLLPLALNQWMTSEFLYRFHKILALVLAFVVFISWITALKYCTRRRSSTG